MATNVPRPILGDKGFTVPTEAQILAGVVADMQEAFGGALNLSTNSGAPINSTPQGQLATSMAAIIAQNYYTMLALFAGFDPAYSSGRMQDGLARIYFLQRHPDLSTTVTCTCIGVAGTVIPQLARIIDESGYIYYARTGGTIPISGSIDLLFSNEQTGAIPCPAGTANRIYQAVPGWDTVNNAEDGTLGNVVETRAEFEARRELTVFNNSAGFAPSMLGNVLKVDDVADAYIADNCNGYQLGFIPEAIAIAHISGTTLTIEDLTQGTVRIGQTVTGYDQTGIAVADDTVITGGSGSTWTVNNSQTVAAGTTMCLGGVVVEARSIMAIVSGGDDDEVAKALWEKKPPGSGWDGSEEVTVYDDSDQYTQDGGPGIPYVVHFQRPTNIHFTVLVKVGDSVTVPADALTQIQNAVVAAFAGADGGPRIRIGSQVYASRFYAGIVALGPWAQVYEILIGSENETTVSFTASIADNVMTVSAVASGTLAIGQAIFGTGLLDGVFIESLGTGSGGTGTYNLNYGNMTIGSEGMTAVASTLYRIQTKINQLPVIDPEHVQIELV